MPHLRPLELVCTLFLPKRRPPSDMYRLVQCSEVIGSLLQVLVVEHRSPELPRVKVLLEQAMALTAQRAAAAAAPPAAAPAGESSAWPGPPWPSFLGLWR